MLSDSSNSSGAYSSVSMLFMCSDLLPKGNSCRIFSALERLNRSLCDIYGIINNLEKNINNYADSKEKLSCKLYLYKILLMQLYEVNGSKTQKQEKTICVALSKDHSRCR